MLNGSDFKWHSKTDQPDYSKFDQIARILDSYWFHFHMVVAIALALVPIILIPDHPKSKHEQVWIWNSSEFKNLVFGALTVHLKISTIKTAGIFPYCFNHFFCWVLEYPCHRTIALTLICYFTSQLAVASICIFVILPLTLVGTVLGRNLSGTPNYPCRINAVPRYQCNHFVAFHRIPLMLNSMKAKKIQYFNFKSPSLE